MVIKLKPVYDRSRVVQDWKCPRSRYWGYEYEGRGLVSSTTSLELFMGTTIHDTLAALAQLTLAGKEIDIDTLARGAYQQMFDHLSSGVENDFEAVEFALEQASLVEGLMRGFYKHTWPRLMAAYPTILFTEEEMEHEHDGLVFMSKPDLILANSSGEAVYIEYKSTSSKREEWVNSWNTAVQLHSTIKAVESTKGLKLQSVIVQGLYKGYESYGKQSSPFCYAYKKAGNPPFTKDQIEYEFKAGFRRSPTWELPGGVKGWVESMPESVLAGQFPQTPPITINEELVDAFFRQRKAREWEIQVAKDILAEGERPEVDLQSVMDKYFPQRFDQCVPSFGRGCQFRLLCHGNVDDPLTAGYFWREPHHALEADMFAE